MPTAYLIGTKQQHKHAHNVHLTTKAEAKSAKDEDRPAAIQTVAFWAGKADVEASTLEELKARKVASHVYVAPIEAAPPPPPLDYSPIDDE